MKSRTPWTSEEVRMLEDLAKQKTSLQVIALKLGRSAAAVEAKAAQLKIAVGRMKRRYTRKSSAGAGESSQENPARDQRDHEAVWED